MRGSVFRKHCKFSSLESRFRRMVARWPAEELTRQSGCGNGNTLSVAPVEAFFSDFFHPGLLQDIFNGDVPTTDVDISRKDIRQLQLKLSLNDEATAEQSARAKDKSNTEVANRSVAVKIEITDGPAGAQDVRLFRNGSLVRVWHGDVLKGQSRAAVYATVPIVAGENLFTAYAFNHDNVKSTDASVTAIGAASLRRQGIVYVLAVGINEYAAGRARSAKEGGPPAIGTDKVC